MPNLVVHLEVGCINTAAQLAFYGKVFHWEITPIREEWNCGLVRDSEGGAGSGISDSSEALGR